MRAGNDQVWSRGAQDSERVVFHVVQGQDRLEHAENAAGCRGSHTTTRCGRRAPLTRVAVPCASGTRLPRCCPLRQRHNLPRGPGGEPQPWAAIGDSSGSRSGSLSGAGASRIGSGGSGDGPHSPIGPGGSGEPVVPIGSGGSGDEYSADRMISSSWPACSHSYRATI